MDYTWVLVALSLAGNVFVIKKNVIGQWMWAVSNVGWVAFNFYHNHVPQASLFAVYFAMCVWGIWSWTKEAKAAKATQTR
jgi:nicotinamide riboside transporter PnuC